ncbi:MAG: hypothetical protein IPL75_04200 [Acidobacteria bacterium]|nr:hypothetical protein [Acidobacteriota bacterium]
MLDFAELLDIRCGPVAAIFQEQEPQAVGKDLWKRVSFALLAPGDRFWQAVSTRRYAIDGTAQRWRAKQDDAFGITCRLKPCPASR